MSSVVESNSSISPNTRPSPPRQSPALIIVWTYILLIGGALAVFRSPWAMPVGSETSMSLERTIFFTVNAATNTGFQTTISADSLRWPAQLTLLLLMLVGAAVSWVVSGVLICRALQLQFGVRSLLAASFVAVTIAVIGGIVLGPTAQRLQSVFQSISALCNGGIWIGGNPSLRDATTLGWVLPLAAVGAVGMTVFVELARLPIERRLSRHAVTTLAAFAGIYIVGAAALFGMEASGGRINEFNKAEQLAAMSALSLNSRSAGIPLEQLNALERPTQWVAAGLMLIGGGSGGAGGGLKVTLLVVLAVGVVQLLTNRQPPKAFAIGLCWLATYLVVVMGTFLLLLSVVPEQSADRLMLLAISAVGNVGLSHDVLSASGKDAFVLSAAMLAGRFLPLLFLWWLASTREPHEIVVA